MFTTTKEIHLPVHRPRLAGPNEIPVTAHARRPSIGCPSRLRKQESTVSSKHSVSRSRRHGRSSKPSSPPASCAVVDPSISSRHHRVQKSYSTFAVPGRDVDDALALHFRSCTIFTDPSYHTHSSLLTLTEPRTRPSAMAVNSPISATSEGIASQPSHDESVSIFEQMNMTMHWMSPSTRRREYERIDRANRGLRGFYQKLVPRRFSGSPERFYEKDQSDAGSVRRYRLEDVEEATNKQAISRVQTGTCHEVARHAHLEKEKWKKWVCF